STRPHFPDNSRAIRTESPDVDMKISTSVTASIDRRNMLTLVYQIWDEPDAMDRYTHGMRGRAVLLQFYFAQLPTSFRRSSAQGFDRYLADERRQCLGTVV